jgi:hypothetical protein
MKYLILVAPGPMQLNDSRVVADGFYDSALAIQRATEWLDEHGSKEAEGQEFAYVLPYVGGALINDDNVVEEF